MKLLGIEVITDPRMEGAAILDARLSYEPVWQLTSWLSKAKGWSEPLVTHCARESIPWPGFERSPLAMAEAGPIIVGKLVPGVVVRGTAMLLGATETTPLLFVSPL